MLLMVEIVLLGVVLAAISYPLMNSKIVELGDREIKESDLSDLLYKKEAAYIALKDLEFDHKTGKVDDEDYSAMKSQFEAEAIDVLKTIEIGDKEPAGFKAVVSAKFCTDCGMKAAEGHKFCAQCGKAL